MALPEIKYVINEMQFKFMKEENDREIKGQDSLLNIENHYWRGFYGYYIEQLGKCTNISEIEEKISAFAKDLLEYTVSTLNNELPSEELKILYSTLGKLENSRVYVNEIIFKIEKDFNAKWKDSDITVFLISDSFIRAGISSPLLLPAKRNFSIVVQILIHELIHRNACAKVEESIYKKIEREAYKAGIGMQELYNRIMHPLFFYAAWKFTEESKLFKENIPEFYMLNEFSKSKYFLNTIDMLKKLWPVNANLDSSFAYKLINLYITNPDRKKYKGAIV